MAKEKKAPKTVEAIIDFLKAYSNPDDVPDGEGRPIKVYMLNCFEVSYNFIFKWIIKQKEMDEILKWNKDFKLESGVLKLYLDEYRIELVATDKDEETEFGC